MLFELIKDEIRSHLGRNPVRGGNPARDNSNRLRVVKENLEDKTKLNSCVEREIEKL